MVRQAEWSGRQNGQAGRMVKRAEWSSGQVHISETGKGQKKGECKKKKKKQNAKSRTGKLLVDLETYKTNWHRETRNTGINILVQRDRKHWDKYTGTERQETLG
jgi:hypothetical protein